jgi:hypothetical protein
MQNKVALSPVNPGVLDVEAKIMNLLAPRGEISCKR